MMALELSKALVILLLLCYAKFFVLPTAVGYAFKNEAPKNANTKSVPSPFTALKKERASRISAVFAFGDSTVDPGNNNHRTLFRSNHFPYGRDLPNHVPSGRFSNGKLVTDFLVDSLNLSTLLPAYYDAKDDDLITGVSFASAGAGLDDVTSKIVGSAPIWEQFRLFQHALQRIESRIGADETKILVENALFVISAGVNDMLFNFYDIPVRAFFSSVSDYQNMLIRDLRLLIVGLHRVGGRKFAVTGLPPIGCLPLQRAIGSVLPGHHWLHRTCVDRQNADSVAFNVKIQRFTKAVEANLPGTKVVYLDIYNIMMDMINNPAKYGFQVTTEGCCGFGSLEVGSLCNEHSKTCPDPRTFMFWDGLHPSERTYEIIASILVKNDLSKFE